MPDHGTPAGASWLRTRWGSRWGSLSGRPLIDLAGVWQIGQRVV